MFYNAGLRKTVRYLPGHEPPRAVTPAARTLKTPENRETRAETSEPAVSHSDLVEQEHFIPIDFDEAMRIEGHESQVVHVRDVMITNCVVCVCNERELRTEMIALRTPRMACR